MPRNSVGTYTLPQAPFTPGSVISSSAVNSDFSDIATALTGSLAANGTTPLTGIIKNPSGTASAPGVSFGAFPDAGMFPVSSGILGFGAGGIAIAYMDTTKVGTGQSGNQFYYANTAIPSPVGSVTDFAGSTAPAGWLLCFGQSLLRTDYPELFTIIGVTYGAADGTHFSVPDCRGRIGAGRDDMGGSAASRITTAGSGIDGVTLGAAGGAQSVVLDATMIPAHTHTSPALTDPGHTHSLTQQSVASLAPGGSNVVLPIGSTSTSSNGTGITLAATTGSTGGGLLHTNTQPTIIFNKIIFAGRP